MKPPADTKNVPRRHTGAPASHPSRGSTAMKPLRIATALLCLAHLPALAADPQSDPRFEMETTLTPAHPIDKHVLARLRAAGIQPARLCSDSVFVRRVYLDVIGTLPTPDEVRDFLADRRVDKRAALIDELLQRDEFADYWALKWCDLLRVKSEFPINLWPNAVQAYHHWVRDALASNMSYDDFVRALLTSTGSNFRVPPVNFYRAVQGQEPATIAAAVALTFMGARIENWPADRRDGLAACFSRVAFKGTAEWKEEIVYPDPAAMKPLEATLPDGTDIRVVVGADPRRAFAAWLITPENPWFKRNAVNRVWAWLVGRGIIHEPDDVRPDNLPSNPELLAYLEAEFVESNYDLRHLYRLILNSRTYQQSARPRSGHKDAQKLFASYLVRRLDAEVLIDAINDICGASEEYTSLIPEPYTHIPQENRTIALADGSITSPFLDLFGRPSRDTGLLSERNNQPTDAQRLYLLNSSEIQNKIERSRPLRELIRRSRRDPREIVRGLYLRILSRYPTNDEISIATGYLRDSGLNRHQAFHDVVWALLNSKEFLYRH